jgi:hypothetical protein
MQRSKAAALPQNPPTNAAQAHNAIVNPDRFRTESGDADAAGYEGSTELMDTIHTLASELRATDPRQFTADELLAAAQLLRDVRFLMRRRSRRAESRRAPA